MSSQISVIIPTFERAKTLGQAVESALSQRDVDVDVVVIDDGSTDGTRDLISSRFGNDARVRYRYQPNAGVSRARNVGLDMACGDYIAFLDSDDSWKPWHLGLALAGLALFRDAGLIWTDTELIDAQGECLSPSGLHQLFSAYRYFHLDDLFSASSELSDLGIAEVNEDVAGRIYYGDVFSQMVMGNLVLTSTVVMRRDRVEQVGRFDEHLAVGEDYEFFLRACHEGSVAYADIASARYRIGTSDKLGGPGSSLAMSKAYLRVLERTLARDNSRITLSTPMIQEARIHAHRWVGEQELLAGDRRRARAHLASAVRIRPAQPSAILELMLSLFPARAFAVIARWRRRIVHAVR
jgi:glycosyltransferase involved in cell wall biosynthesis